MVEFGVDEEFERAYNMTLTPVAGDAAVAPWFNDLTTLFQALQIVVNNANTSVGGGGAPRRPVAPPICGAEDIVAYSGHEPAVCNMTPGVSARSAPATGSSGAATDSGRRVNWFTVPHGIARSADGLNNTQWAAKYRSAITGYFPCCGLWSLQDDGSFTVAEARLAGGFHEEVAMGLDIVPTGSLSVAALVWC